MEEKSSIKSNIMCSRPSECKNSLPNFASNNDNEIFKNQQSFEKYLQDIELKVPVKQSKSNSLSEDCNDHLAFCHNEKKNYSYNSDNDFIFDKPENLYLKNEKELHHLETTQTLKSINTTCSNNEPIVKNQDPRFLSFSSSDSDSSPYIYHTPILFSHILEHNSSNINDITSSPLNSDNNNSKPFKYEICSNKNSNTKILSFDSSSSFQEDNQDEYKLPQNILTSKSTNDIGKRSNLSQEILLYKSDEIVNPKEISAQKSNLKREHNSYSCFRIKSNPQHERASKKHRSRPKKISKSPKQESSHQFVLLDFLSSEESVSPSSSQTENPFSLDKDNTITRSKIKKSKSFINGNRSTGNMTSLKSKRPPKKLHSKQNSSDEDQSCYDFCDRTQTGFESLSRHSRQKLFKKSQTSDRIHKRSKISISKDIIPEKRIIKSLYIIIRNCFETPLLIYPSQTINDQTDDESSKTEDLPEISIDKSRALVQIKTETENLPNTVFISDEDQNNDLSNIETHNSKNHDITIIINSSAKKIKLAFEETKSLRSMISTSLIFQLTEYGIHNPFFSISQVNFKAVPGFEFENLLDYTFLPLSFKESDLENPDFQPIKDVKSKLLSLVQTFKTQMNKDSSQFNYEKNNILFELAKKMIPPEVQISLEAFITVPILSGNLKEKKKDTFTRAILLPSILMVFKGEKINLSTVIASYSTKSSKKEETAILTLSNKSGQILRKFICENQKYAKLWAESINDLVESKSQLLMDVFLSFFSSYNLPTTFSDMIISSVTSAYIDFPVLLLSLSTSSPNYGKVISDLFLSRGYYEFFIRTLVFTELLHKNVKNGQFIEDENNYGEAFLNFDQYAASLCNIFIGQSSGWLQDIVKNIINFKINTVERFILLLNLTIKQLDPRGYMILRTIFLATAIFSSSEMRVHPLAPFFNFLRRVIYPYTEFFPKFESNFEQIFPKLTFLMKSETIHQLDPSINNLLSQFMQQMVYYVPRIKEEVLTINKMEGYSFQIYGFIQENLYDLITSLKVSLTKPITQNPIIFSYFSNLKFLFRDITLKV